MAMGFHLSVNHNARGNPWADAHAALRTCYPAQFGRQTTAPSFAPLPWTVRLFGRVVLGLTVRAAKSTEVEQTDVTSV